MNRKKIYEYTAIFLIGIGFLTAAVPSLTDIYSNSYQSYALKSFDENFKMRNRNKSSEKINAAEALFVLEIPKINIKAAVVRGTNFVDLMKGPGWYVDSALPGKGNTAIAGHRTMFGAWFNRLHMLRPGDEIIVWFEKKKFVYQVEEIFKVNPSDTTVIKDTGYPALTLTTCEPIGRATQRLIVRAKLVKIDNL